MSVWWWMAAGILFVWGVLSAFYLISLVNYIMHNRVDRDDTIDVMVDEEAGDER